MAPLLGTLLLLAACSGRGGGSAPDDPPVPPGDDSGGDAPPARRVDVFVAAGEGETWGEALEGATCDSSAECRSGEACVDRTCTRPGDAWAAACNHDDLSRCKVYALTVDLDALTVVDARLALDPVTDLREGSTILFPAVSADNDLLAVEVRDGQGPGVIQACRLSTRACATVSQGAPGNEGRYPSWIGDAELFFSLETDPAPGWSDTWGTAIDPSGREPSAAGEASIELGAEGTPAGQDTSAFAFAGPYAFTRGGARLVATHGNWPDAPPCRDDHGEPAEGDDCVFLPSSVPAVWDLDAGVGQPVSLDLSEIEDPWACAHVAVSPDGERLVCTVQETYADTEHVGPDHVYGYPYLTGADSDRDGVADALVRQYFPLEFGPRGDGTWQSTTGREMFAPAGPAELEAMDPRFDQAACATPGMSVWVHKYTRYCGDAEHVVTAVWCEGPTELGAEVEGAPNRVVHSSVFLVDLTDRAHPRYLDLGGALARALPEVAPTGLLEAASGACGAAYGGEE